jgi:DNA-binding PadR family transcriptional regulator
MSKGHGRIERAILAVLGAKGGADAATLACTVVAGEVTRSELESVRRALRNLQSQGLVEVTEQQHVVYRLSKSGQCS